MTWDPHEIHAHCLQSLQQASRQFDDEQQPKGLDALPEIAIQSILAAGLESRGWIVLREQHYPQLRRPLAGQSARERCDLVLLPLDAPQPHDPASGFWLEVKSVGQFAYRRGIPGPNRQYSTQLIAALCNDLQKLEDDRQLRAGGILDVLFTADEATATHDIAIALSRCIDKQLLPPPPLHDSFKLADRIGNAICSVWLTSIGERKNAK
ncbi:MAG: hypothetical protein IT435_01370 [Phycisphaerales bacterium]|nr:hypothetical protein [Phycisphaerales bacterium]